MLGMYGNPFHSAHYITHNILCQKPTFSWFATNWKDRCWPILSEQWHHTRAKNHSNSRFEWNHFVSLKIDMFELWDVHSSNHHINRWKSINLLVMSFPVSLFISVSQWKLTAFESHWPAVFGLGENENVSQCRLRDEHISAFELYWLYIAHIQ